MPWTTADVERHKKGLTDEQKEKWAATANSVRAQCIKDGGDEEECDARAIRIANGTAAEVDMGELNEAVTKSVSGKKLPASSFLVVGDAEEVGTWALPVKDAAGKPDHRLMGGAYAALTRGYRGQRYAGPNKAAALTKLRALYRAEDMPIPGAAETAADSLAYIEELLVDVKAVLAEQGIDICVCPECGEEAEHERGTPCSTVDCPECGAKMTPKTGETEESEPELKTVKLAETYVGVELLTEGIAEADAQGPLTLKVRPIRPGFGNKRDNHYYPADMLKRDAHKLVGLKMYESDHKADKNTRNWVSTTTSLLGFDNIGAPILEAVAHNPDFAQRMRNLNASEDADGNNLLEKMECSILGDGKVKKNQVREGRKANVVEALTVMDSLDWVTRAGAGGKALAISESEDSMSDEDKKDVTLDEGTPPEEPKVEEPKVEPKPLVEKEVAGILAETSLPESAKTYLAEGEYENAEAVNEAVTKHIEYLKAVTGSGKPFGHEGGSTETQMSDEEYDKRYTALMESCGVRQFGN